MYGEAAERVRQALLDFFRSCPLAVRLPNGIFICHSMPEQVDSRLRHEHLFRGPWTPPSSPSTAPSSTWCGAAITVRPTPGPSPNCSGAKSSSTATSRAAKGFAVPNPYQLILDCCGEKASYAILPVAEDLSQEAVIQQVRRLA